MQPLSRDQRLLLAAAFLRALGVGLIAVILSIYLSQRGLNAARIGGLIAVGLAGLAGGNFFVSFFADFVGRRKTLMLLSAASALGGVGLAVCENFFWLLGIAFVGMVNAMGRDRGAGFTLEQAILPETTSDRHRTQIIAWYNLILDAGMALGSLAGGLPALLRERFALPAIASYQGVLLLYAGFGIGSLLLYAGLGRAVEIHDPTPWHKVSRQTRGILARLSLLFGFDSFAGGFLPASLVAFFFFRRFGIGEAWIGPLFFTGHLLTAASYLAAAWLSRRIGLLRTMVLAHIPANLCLVALPFVPTLGVAIILFLTRELLVEMDVPTRQSYVMGLVGPKERTLASGVTNLTRTAAWAVAPGLAGWAMKAMWLGTPLIVGGLLKVVYDLTLYRQFRYVRPPEER